MDLKLRTARGFNNRHDAKDSGALRGPAVPHLALGPRTVLKDCNAHPAPSSTTFPTAPRSDLHTPGAEMVVASRVPRQVHRSAQEGILNRNVRHHFRNPVVHFVRLLPDACSFLPPSPLESTLRINTYEKRGGLQDILS